MSLYDYQASRELEATNASFYAIIMAAMRRADTDNLEKLRAMWPEVWDELQERYNAPGGGLESDHRKQECPTCGGDPYVQPCEDCGATGHEVDD